MIDYMEIALQEARLAEGRGEVPIGAVLVDGITGEVLARAGNRCEEDHDVSAHAEILVLRMAAKLKGSARLIDCDLYVTLEPCTMCATAISFARIRRLYFGAYDPKGGGVDHGAQFYNQPTCHHKPDVYGGLHESECAAMLKAFFEKRRS
jgi:tRNA(adenine34) deaminase